MKHLIFIFLDGTGIGEIEEHNPFYEAGAKYLPFFNGGLQLPDGTPIKPIDAMLGVEGVPQSATGQTSIFTGENVPALVEGHKGSYPNRRMRQLLREKNIISRLKKRNLEASFINAYPFYGELFRREHLDILEDGSFYFSDAFPPLFRRRISTTSCMMVLNRQRPFSEKDIIEEKSIYQDFPNTSINHRIRQEKKKGNLPPSGEFIEVPEFSPEKAAEILYKGSRKNDFTLYEYFQTDVYGHRHGFDERVELVSQLDRFIGKFIALLDPAEDTLLITSDHGNLEEGEHRNHTLNPVPLLTWGHKSDQLRNRIHDLTGIAPAIENYFQDRSF